MVIYLFIYLFIIGIGSLTLETKNSHDLLAKRYRTRKASDVIQSESEGLRTRGVDRVCPYPHV